MASPSPTKRMRSMAPVGTPVTLIESCKDLRISPPRFEIDGVRIGTMSLEVIETKVAEDGFAKFWDEEKKQAVLIFLYGRRFYHNNSDENRRQRVQKLLDSNEAIERILRIAAVGGDKAIETATVSECKPPTPASSGMRMNTTKSPL